MSYETNSVWPKKNARIAKTNPVFLCVLCVLSRPKNPSMLMAGAEVIEGRIGGATLEPASAEDAGDGHLILISSIGVLAAKERKEPVT